MELLPIIASGGSVALSSFNTFFLQKQSRILKTLENRSAISVDEIQKFIHEKDEVLGHVYTLYNIVTELTQILTSLLSLSYYSTTSFQSTLESVRMFKKHSHHPSYVFHKSEHPDIRSFIGTLVRLLGWIELKRTNRTAIHAFHSGPLHLAIDAFSQFLHNTTNIHLRISLLDQKRLGQSSRQTCN